MVRLRPAVPTPRELCEQGERALIAADARFFLDLALSPRLEPIRPTATLVLMPFLSAFLYESIRYTKREQTSPLIARRMRAAKLAVNRDAVACLCPV
jgi:hypothetical protein